MLSFGQTLGRYLLVVSLGVAAGCDKGPKIEDYVVLKNGQSEGASCGANTQSFADQALFRIFPDGTRSETPFSVPKGRYLKVTDVEWSGFGSNLGPLRPDWTLRLVIEIDPPTNVSPLFRKIVFMSRGITIREQADGGRPGSTEYATTGFLVASGTPICPRAVQNAQNAGAVVRIENLVLRGYLVDHH